MSMENQYEQVMPEQQLADEAMGLDQLFEPHPSDLSNDEVRQLHIPINDLHLQVTRYTAGTFESRVQQGLDQFLDSYAMPKAYVGDLFSFLASSFKGRCQKGEFDMVVQLAALACVKRIQERQAATSQKEAL